MAAADEKIASAPVVLMARLSAALETAGEPLGRTQLAELVSGKRAQKFAAIDALIAEGFVAVDGDGRGARLTLREPYAGTVSGNRREKPSPVDRGTRNRTKRSKGKPEHALRRVVQRLRHRQPATSALTDERVSVDPRIAELEQVRAYWQGTAVALMARNAQLEQQIAELTAPPRELAPGELAEKIRELVYLAHPFPSSPPATLNGGSRNGY